MNSQKLDPSVFVRAAELVASGAYEFSCDAIMDCTNLTEWVFEEGNPGPHQAFFRKMFKPKRDFGFGWWHDDDCEPRVLALLLCAEMAREPQS